MTPSEQLCLACGLCCDGTLFGNVRLNANEDAQRLRELGLPVEVTRGKNPLTLFRQPCTALCADRTCQVYANRPAQCASFECGVFKEARAGRLDFAAALRLVKKARREADRIRGLLHALGDTDSHRSLDERFRRTQRRLESATPDPAAAHAFAELSQAVHAFGLLTHEKFYTREG